MEPSSAVIQTRGLVKDYETFHALGPLDCDVPAGAVGLLGPNGAGKTTLIKTLLGLVPATSGEAYVLGLPVAQRSQDIRQLIGYMPEQDAQIPNMNGFQYVAYAGQLAGLPRRDAIQRAHEVLNYVGLSEERYRSVDGYSTGMRQRAKLAQAIVHDPKLVFLDEPTNGLDPKGRTDMLDLIRDLSIKQGVSVILSSHLLPDVESVCDHVMVLKQGSLAAAGSIASLKERDLGNYEVRIKGDPAAFIAALKKLGCGGDVDDTGGLRIRLPKGRDARIILQAAADAKVQLRHFLPLHSSLEDVFMQTVGGA